MNYPTESQKYKIKDYVNVPWRPADLEQLQVGHIKNKGYLNKY